MRPAIGEPARGKLPRGMNSLPKKVVDAEQRKRLVVAMAHVVAVKGYAETTVADVIAEASVSRTTFYELFTDKEDCFLYGFKKLSVTHLDEAERELQRDFPLPERLQRAVQVYLLRINLDLALAKAFIAEAEGATPRIRDALAETRARFLQAWSEWLNLVRTEYPLVPHRGPKELSLLSSGLNGFLVSQIRRSEPFSEADVRLILRYLFAGFGLYGWAEHVENLVGGDGNAGEPTLG